LAIDRLFAAGAVGGLSERFSQLLEFDQIVLHDEVFAVHFIKVFLKHCHLGFEN